MKLVKLSLIIVAVVLISFGIGATSYAFHSGGVAECEGCHTMHNSFENSAMDVNAVYGTTSMNKYLLKGSDQSSTCLNCHQEKSDTVPSSYHIDTRDSQITANGVPTEMTPGGDFGWLKITTTYSSHGTPATSEGQRRGHSIVAFDFGYAADTVNTAAPNGIAPFTGYPATSLSCISCHNPHSNYRVSQSGFVDNTANLPIYTSGSYGAQPTATAAVGVYRFLGGTGYQPKSVTGSWAFTAMPPVAVSPSGYNANEGGANETHVAYGSGMAQWCANCHTNFLNTTLNLGAGAHPHPAGAAFGSATNVIANYNGYLGSGNVQAGQGKFTSLVPFETGDTATSPNLTSKATSTAAADAYGLAPASATSQVMCLSCHRAHAGGFESMTRWWNDSEWIVNNGAYPTGNSGGGLSTTQMQTAYYGRAANWSGQMTFASYQRSLCNKCHAKD
jgi:hypothetical protein